MFSLIKSMYYVYYEYLCPDDPNWIDEWAEFNTLADATECVNTNAPHSQFVTEEQYRDATTPRIRWSNASNTANLPF